MVIYSQGFTDTLLPATVDANLLDRRLFPEYPISTTEFGASTPKDFGLNGLSDDHKKIVAILVILGLLWVFGRGRG